MKGDQPQGQGAINSIPTVSTTRATGGLADRRPGPRHLYKDAAGRLRRRVQTGQARGERCHDLPRRLSLRRRLGRRPGGGSAQPSTPTGSSTRATSRPVSATARASSPPPRASNMWAPGSPARSRGKAWRPTPRKTSRGACSKRGKREGQGKLTYKSGEVARGSLAERNTDSAAGGAAPAEGDARRGRCTGRFRWANP